MTRIEIVTSRLGGPLTWGRDLSQVISMQDNYNANHAHSLMGIITLTVKKYDILHSTLPLNNFFKRGKNILTVHGNYKKENNFWSQYYDGAIKAASFVTVPSEYLKNELNINNLGFQNTRDYLKESDIFVYCSYLDNMPFAILEAMACGMPVVSNDVGAVKEIINNGIDGIIANDRFDFGQKLTNLINDFDSRVTIGQRARETIKSSYDWKVVVEKYKTLYEHLL